MNNKINLGLKANLNQFVLLIIVNAFVGGMVGLERSILPQIAEKEFHLAIKTAILSFIIVFGIVKAIANYNINVNMRPRHADESLVADIEEAIQKINPSMVVMFTEQNRSWFEKIFLSSKSAEYSFDAKVPMLVFHKS